MVSTGTYFTGNGDSDSCAVQTYRSTRIAFSRRTHLLLLTITSFVKPVQYLPNDCGPGAENVNAFRQVRKRIEA